MQPLGAGWNGTSNELDRPPLRAVVGQLHEAGFALGQQPNLTEDALAGTPHNLSFASLRSGLTRIPKIVGDCAIKLLEAYHIDPSSCSQPTSLVPLLDGIFLGPLQHTLINQLRELPYRPQILSGYRSENYQAVLFSLYYLSGRLFDAYGRLRVAPPGESDHSHVDRAFDIADHNLFMLHLFLLEPLPCSLYRPYLSGQHMTVEPWHWRCHWHENSDADEVLSNSRPRRQEIERLIAYVQGNPDGTNQPYHVFASGLALYGASACVGSRQATLGASIEDALAAVGTGWDLYYLTHPTGYTPVMDNVIQEKDVGRCLFWVNVRNSPAESFFTGQSSIAARILSPSRVLNELLAKTGRPELEDFRLHKSRTFDLVHSTDGTYYPASYGVPYSPFERVSDIPDLIIADYIGWLRMSLEVGGPIYSSHDYCRSYTMHCDPMRYAMLLAHLLRFSGNLPSEIDIVIKQVFSQYCWGDALDRLLDGVSLPHDQIPEATVLFLISALESLGHSEHANALWLVHKNSIRRYTEAVLNSPDDPNGWLFLGHLCESLLRGGRASVPRIEALPLSEESLATILGFRFRGPLYAAAFAQLLRLAMHQGFAAATEMVEEFLVYLIAYPESTSEFEVGAVAGLESFQTSLPLEAILALTPIAQIGSTDRRRIKDRILRGLRFLRQLQFVSTCGIASPNPHLLSGAVRYSLIDHHLRMDYGLHCLNVAVGLTQLAD